MEAKTAIKKSLHYKNCDLPLVNDILNIINEYVNHDLIIIYNMSSKLYDHVFSKIINERILGGKNAIIRIMDLYIDTLNELKNTFDIKFFFYRYAKISGIDHDTCPNSDGYVWHTETYGYNYMMIIIKFWIDNGLHLIYPQHFNNDSSCFNNYYHQLVLQYKY